MKKRIISAAVAGMMFFTCRAFADVLSVDTLSVNPDTQTVTISGSVEGADHLQKVTLRVTKDEDGSLNYITQSTINPDGSFLIEYKMTGDSGNYTVHVNTNDAQEDYTGSIFFVDPNVITEILANINQMTDASALYEYISDPEVQKNLGINTAELEVIGPAEDACGLVIASGTEFETATQFVDMLHIKTILAGLNAAEGAADVKNLISLYHTDLGLDGLKRYESYSADEELADGTAERLAEMSFETEEEFSESFEEQTALEMISQVSGYGEVYDILEENNDIFGLSFSVYNGLNNKNPVLQELAGEDYKTAEDLKEAFDTACEERSDAEDDNGGGGGGGSHGSSSGGTSSGGSPSGIVIRDNQPEDQTTPDEDGQEEEQTEEKHYFDDIANYAWAEEGINFLYEQGIVAGDGSGNFRPSDSVKREEFIKMLAEMFGFENTSGTGGFIDVADGAWYTDYVYAAVSEGVVSGYPDGSFGIGTDISRQDIAVILTRTLEKYEKELSEKNEKKTFSDEDQISDYAADSVKYMQKAGIINGFEDGTFAPQNSATRAEAARILYLIYEEIN